MNMIRPSFDLEKFTNVGKHCQIEIESFIIRFGRKVSSTSNRIVDGHKETTDFGLFFLSDGKFCLRKGFIRM
jgi:hypothetical protein